jgi:hypothetical protein
MMGSRVRFGNCNCVTLYTVGNSRAGKITPAFSRILLLQRGPHGAVAIGSPDHGVINALCFIVGA